MVGDGDGEVSAVSDCESGCGDICDVLNALKLSQEPSSRSQPNGPDPFKPGQWPLLVVVCVGLVAANALLSP